MHATKIVIFLFVYLFTFCAWLFIFQEDKWTQSLGTNTLSLISSAVSFIILFHTYRVRSQKYRYAWLLLSISALFHFIGYSIYFYYQTFLAVSAPYLSWADYMWMISYGFILAAFLYILRLKVDSEAIEHVPFNLVLFLIVAVTFSMQYIVEPLLIQSDHTFVFIIYPLLDLCIMFTLIVLYYLSLFPGERTLIALFLIGTVVQLGTDLIYIYWIVDDFAAIGTFLDPIWQMSLFLKAIAGLYTQRYIKEIKVESPKIHTSFFPYIATIFLTILIVYKHYMHMDTLLRGTLIAVFLIIVHQFFVMRKNDQLMAEYKHLAYHDPLTGLGNRTKFEEDMNRLCMNASPDSKAALLLIDLDRFKRVNDTLGHQAGDSLLKEISSRLQQDRQTKMTIYRMGGDEFLVLLPNINSTSDALAAAGAILSDLQDPVFVRDTTFVITPSIGIVMYPEHSQDPKTLLRNADAAMYMAKENGKNTYRLYNSALDKYLIEKVQIETHLRRAIEENEFILYYQPKVDLSSRKIIGTEALIRWKHPAWGLVSPFKFIPVAEETGQIVSIGKWVLREACTQTKKWQEEGLSPTIVSVNISVRQFEQSDFIQSLASILKETNLNPQFLELEITESVLQDLSQSTVILQSLREMGVRISIDDFGTGYSSLSVIKNLPLDVIKIDKSFLNELDQLTNQNLLKAILEIGKSLDLQIIVEGVETESQRNMLLDCNYQYGQGYLFGKPMAGENFKKLISMQERVI